MPCPVPRKFRFSAYAGIRFVVDKVPVLKLLESGKWGVLSSVRLAGSTAIVTLTSSGLDEINARGNQWCVLDVKCYTHNKTKDLDKRSPLKHFRSLAVGVANRGAFSKERLDQQCGMKNPKASRFPSLSFSRYSSLNFPVSRLITLFVKGPQAMVPGPTGQMHASISLGPAPRAPLSAATLTIWRAVRTFRTASLGVRRKAARR